MFARWMDYSIYKAIDGTGPHFLHAPLKFAANDLVFVIVGAGCLLTAHAVPQIV